MRRAWILCGLLAALGANRASCQVVLTKGSTYTASPIPVSGERRREPAVITTTLPADSGVDERVVVAWIDGTFNAKRARIHVASAPLSTMSFSAPTILEPTVQANADDSTGDPFFGVDANTGNVYIAGISRRGLSNEIDTFELSVWKWYGDGHTTAESICAPGGGNGAVDKPSVAVRAYVDGGGQAHSVIYVAHMLLPQQNFAETHIHVHRK